MGRIQRSGSTCGTAGSADALHIQHDQHGFSFDEQEGEVDIVRKSLRAVTVQPAVRDLVLQTSDQIIPQFDLLAGLGIHNTHSALYSSTQSHDTRNVLCTSSAASLLCSAVYKGTDLHTLADI